MKGGCWGGVFFSPLVRIELAVVNFSYFSLVFSCLFFSFSIHKQCISLLFIHYRCFVTFSFICSQISQASSSSLRYSIALTTTTLYATSASASPFFLDCHDPTIRTYIYIQSLFFFFSLSFLSFIVTSKAPSLIHAHTHMTSFLLFLFSLLARRTCAQTQVP